MTTTLYAASRPAARTAGILAAVLTVAVGTGLAGPVRAGADDVASFTATALAQGMRASAIASRFLFTETLADVGTAVTQAQLTTIGGRAYASSLFPGDTAVYRQAAAAVGLPPPPPYPLEVSAAHPSEPETRADQPGQPMSAKAGPARAASQAAVGGAVSHTTVEALADGSVVARAESVVEGAAFPGDLQIARIESVATATLAPGATAPTAEALTTVTGVSVAGTAVGVGPDGIIAPQPVGPRSGAAQPLDESLARAGTAVRRIRGEPVAGGASSDVIEVRSRLAAQGAPEATVLYRLGGATASVLTGALASPGPLVVPPAGTRPAPMADGKPLGGTAGPAGSTSLAGGAQPLTAPGAGSSFADTAPARGMSAPETLLSTPAEGDADPVPERVSRARREMATPAQFDGGVLGETRRDELGVLYLVVILGAVAAFAAASILRQKGVDRSWSS